MSSCAKCDELQRAVAQAEGALNLKLKPLASLSYSQVVAIENCEERKRLRSAQIKRSRHRSKCGERP